MYSIPAGDSLLIEFDGSEYSSPAGDSLLVDFMIVETREDGFLIIGESERLVVIPRDIIETFSASGELSYDFKTNPVIDDEILIQQGIYGTIIFNTILLNSLDFKDSEALKFLKRFGELFLTNTWAIKEVDEPGADLLDLDHFISPQEVDLTVYQGATFKATYSFFKTDELKPYNILGWSGRMQIRKKKKDTDISIELTTENGGISFSVTETATKYTIYMTPEQTAALSAGGVYDIELIDFENNVLRIQQGAITLSTEVTR